MSSEQLIPNAVGRIDAITEAIRDGDRERANKLIQTEESRLLGKHEQVKTELTGIENAVNDIRLFQATIQHDDAWHQARRECGWKGDE